jgi:serine/threonine-protein kinase
VGWAVGNYCVKEKLSDSGGFAEVYVAEHVETGNKAAVKILRGELCGNRDIVKRFFIEARAAARIRHPAVVEIYDVGRMRNRQPYMVMQYLDGEPLSHRLARDETISFRQAVGFARQVASGLAAAHARHVVHRDLKPDNIFLVPDPEVAGGVRAKIIDFGIAKLAADAAGAVVKTQHGAFMGTPRYASPEQFEAMATADERTDLYSLGCVLYEMLTGAPPFPYKIMEMVRNAHLTEPAASPRSRVPEIPEALDALTLKLLAKDPNDRHASAEELVAALDALLGDSAALVGQAPVSTRQRADAATMSSRMRARDTDVDAMTEHARPVGAAAARTGAPVKQATTLGNASGQVSAPEALASRRRSALVVAAAIGGAAVAGAAVVAIALPLLEGKGADERARGSAAAVTAVAPAAAGVPGAHPGAVPGLDRAPPPDRAVVEPRAAAPAAAAPATVTLTITSVPAGAKVYREADGVLVGETPYRQTFARGAGEAAFLLKRSHYHDARVTLATDRDSSKSVTLTRRSSHESRDDTAPGGSRRKGQPIDPFAN